MSLTPYQSPEDKRRADRAGRVKWSVTVPVRGGFQTFKFQTREEAAEYIEQREAGNVNGRA
jgi:hypothetical protein